MALMIQSLPKSPKMASSPVVRSAMKPLGIHLVDVGMPVSFGSKDRIQFAHVLAGTAGGVHLQSAPVLLSIITSRRRSFGSNWANLPVVGLNPSTLPGLYGWYQSLSTGLPTWLPFMS